MTTVTVCKRDIYPYSHCNLLSNENNDKPAVIENGTTDTQLYTILTTRVNHNQPMDNTDGHENQKEQTYNKTELLNPSGQSICISPPTFISHSEFITTHQTQINTQIKNSNDIEHLHAELFHVTEFVEGVLVSLFYNCTEHHWDIMTKNVVGGNAWFTRTEYTAYNGDTFVYAPQHTFYDMFMDAVGGQNVYVNQILPCCDPNVVYNFVVNHPANPIISKPSIATATLVYMQHIKPGDVSYTRYGNIRDNPFNTCHCNHDNINVSYSQCHCIKLPTIVTQYLVNDILSGFYPHNCVITCLETDIQTVYLTPEYKNQKYCRHNDPNIMYTFFELLKIDSCGTFIRSFPWFIHLFDWFTRIYQEYIDLLFIAYNIAFIHKQPHIKYKKTVYYHISQIHDMIQHKKKITKSIIAKYLLLQPTTSLLHAHLQHTYSKK